MIGKWYTCKPVADDMGVVNASFSDLQESAIDEDDDDKLWCYCSQQILAK